MDEFDFGDNSWNQVYWATLTGFVSCLATGLGAIPAHFIHYRQSKVISMSTSFAAGMMISVSILSLAQQGISLKSKHTMAPTQVIIGLMLGSLFFWWTEKMVEHYQVEYKGLSKKGILVFIAMLVHSFPEGVAIGTGFATGNFHFGILTAIAIGIHNIPEGIAISLPLKQDGMSTFRCAVFSILTSVPQPLMAGPAVLLALQFEPYIALGLGFAGGAMLFLVLSEMLPDALAIGGKVATAWGVMLGICTMMFIMNIFESSYFSLA